MLLRGNDAVVGLLDQDQQERIRAKREQHDREEPGRYLAQSHAFVSASSSARPGALDVALYRIGRDRTMKSLERESPTCSVLAKWATRPCTRCEMRICPPAASPHNRAARLSHRPDRAVIAASFEADGADGGEALSDADSHRQFVSAPLPSLRERRKTFLHCDRHFHGLGGGIVDSTGSLKKIMMPSPANRSSVPPCAITKWPIAS